MNANDKNVKLLELKKKYFCDVKDRQSFPENTEAPKKWSIRLKPQPDVYSLKGTIKKIKTSQRIGY